MNNIRNLAHYIVLGFIPVYSLLYWLNVDFSEIERIVFVIICGEINALDYDAWVVDYEAFAEGGATDLNGDGFVDANDYVLYEANIGKSVIRP